MNAKLIRVQVSDIPEDGGFREWKDVPITSSELANLNGGWAFIIRMKDQVAWEYFEVSMPNPIIKKLSKNKKEKWYHRLSGISIKGGR